MARSKMIVAREGALQRLGALLPEFGLNLLNWQVRALVAEEVGCLHPHKGAAKDG